MRHKKFLLCVSNFLLCFLIINKNININCYCDSLSQLRQKANKIKQNSSETSKLINQAKEQKNNTKQEINNLDLELIKAKNELDQTINKLEYTKKKLAQNEKDLEQAKLERQNQYDSYKQRLKFIYENGKMAYIKIIFKANSCHDFLKRVEYVNYIIKYDCELLNKLKATEDLISNKVQAIKTEQNQIKNLLAQKEKYKSNLESKLRSKEEFINQINSDIEKYEQKLKDLEKSSNEIANLIKKSELELARAREQQEKAKLARQKKQTKNKSNIDFNYTGGKLGWPVPGRTLISSGYGSRTSPIKGKSEFHTGLDIPAPMGTPIHAAEDGIVINSGSIRGYGYTIIINHGNGLCTLYGHNSSLIAKVGQTVKRGDVIALAGSTGYSTGPHCHFEVRLNGKHTNPSNYLNK